MARRIALLSLVLSLLPVAPALARTWSWPLRGRVVQRFRYGANPFARGQHRGIEIAAGVGTTVRAACGGRVRFAGSVGSSGPVVSVACKGFVASYLHLERITVRRGQRITAGRPLGTVRASRRRARGSSLYLGARRAGRRWGYVDPLRLLRDQSVRGTQPGTVRRPGGRPGTRRLPPRLGPAPAPRQRIALRPLAPRARIVVPAGRSPAAAPFAAVFSVGASLAFVALTLPLLRLRRTRRRSRGAAPAAARRVSEGS
ncbi:MAG TPA: M23 family metallopeptidase [Solirubrobacteraceae bacterium]|nr:M23 family metallopeptidase [Solirubrobacteraceae bacterium]